MKITPVILSGALLALTSCGAMPSISMDNAIKLASEIKTRQDDPALFTLPENFTIEYSESAADEEKTECGFAESNGFIKSIYELDLKNLRYREYTKTDFSSMDSEQETIVFYDNAKGILYEANNQNGYKTRTEASKTKSDALDYLKSEYQMPRAREIKWRGTGGAITLDTYETSISEYEEQHKKFENENDQYVNPRYGSSGAKDLQTIVDSKLKCTAHPSYGSELTYEGYSNKYLSITLKNDMTETNIEKLSYECHAKESNDFYIKHNHEKHSSYHYGNTSIRTPNIDEYIKVN